MWEQVDSPRRRGRIVSPTERPDRETVDSDASFRSEVDTLDGVSVLDHDGNSPRERIPRLRRLSNALDSAVTTSRPNIRIGLDPILGVIPGVGDPVRLLEALLADPTGKQRNRRVVVLGMAVFLSALLIGLAGMVAARSCWGRVGGVSQQRPEWRTVGTSRCRPRRRAEQPLPDAGPSSAHTPGGRGLGYKPPCDPAR